MATILIIDDDADFRDTLVETVVALGHIPVPAKSGAEGLALAASESIDAVLLDYRMPGMDGLEVLKRLMAAPETTRLPVVMLTAFASGGNTIDAMRLGAFDHLMKPAGRDEIAAVLGSALAERRASAPLVAARLDMLVGSSAAMRTVQKLIGRAAAADTTVLITGESGVGKELVARAIHRHGSRAAKDFVAINCAAIPEALLESELFGHERGAFTGAAEKRKGLFQSAEGGTLMLDEIGDMALALQAKVLRAIDDRKVQPVGATRAVPIDVRIIAATHRDLSTLIADSRFRQDLYYRLAVLAIDVPPLRKRRDDIVPLAEHFLGAVAASPRGLTDSAAAKLQAHDWPGNVRELRNAIERAVVMTRATVLDADDLCLSQASRIDRQDTNTEGGASVTLGDAVARLEACMIRDALLEAGGNRAEAARRLGIRRQLLYVKMRQHGIES